MNVILNFSMRVRVQASGAGDVGVDCGERSKDLFQLRVRAAGAGGV